MTAHDDIIDHPHYQSKTRPHMSLADRAAQFAPFAALTGYEEAINDTQLKHLEMFSAPQNDEPRSHNLYDDTP